VWPETLIFSVLTKPHNSVTFWVKIEETGVDFTPTRFSQ
jgi:hypothetical protein